MRFIIPLLLFLSCTPAFADQPTAVVSLSGDRRLDVYSIDNDGKLISQSETDIQSKPGASCFDRSGNNFYVGGGDPATIGVFQLKEHQLIPQQSVQVPGKPSFLKVTPSGDHLLASYYADGLVTVHRIVDAGRLSENPVQTLTVGPRAHCVTTDLSGKFVFVAHTSGDQISQFQLNEQTGELTPNTPATLQRGQGVAPRHLWFHPKGNFAFGSNEKGRSISVYAFDEKTGLLDETQTLPSVPADYQEKAPTSHVEATASGKYAYIANRVHGTIAAFSFEEQSGKLSFLQRTKSPKMTRSFALSPAGDFLLAAGQKSDRLVCYQIQQDGALNKSDTATSGKTPWWISFAPTATSQKDSLLKSPSGDVGVQFSTSKEGRLQYSVRFKGREVVELSPLGITVDGIDLGIGTEIGAPRLRTIDQTYQTRGKHTQARNHYRQWRFPIHHHGNARDYTIEFRIYDDGVALRYEVPGETIQHVDGESSSWTIVEGAKTWYFERLNRGWKLKSYAGEWLSTDISKLSTASPPKVGPVQGTPLVFELPEGIGYAAITKAALYNYSGMRLRAVGDRRVVADFVEGAKGFDVDGTIVTPWRVTMLANDLDALVNSNLISNLNPAPDPELFADVSYIRPGRSVWSWETLGLDSVETQRTFIDLAAELGFEYSIVDDGWKDWPEPWQSITALCEHGANKNVGVWVWSHSQDIDDPTGNYQIMRQYLQRVAKAGAIGVKIDFMNGESKRLVDFEIAALRIAAEHRLMINFHGCHASTGESRTWPNEMTREGIRGMEVNKMREGPLPASHNAALPFTRFVVGHGDYTPILYSNPGPTTCAHQLATTVIFDSPLQIYAEHPHTMMKSPDLKNACDVTKSIPTVWDETIVLPGSKIGEIAAFARRSVDKWFVGILNGGDQRAYQLKLDFLNAIDYDARIVQDDLNREPISVAAVGVNTKADLKQWTTTVPFKVSQRSAISAQSKLSVELATGGGLVIVLTPTVKN